MEPTITAEIAVAGLSVAEVRDDRDRREHAGQAQRQLPSENAD